MTEANLPFIYIDSAGTFCLEQGGTELEFIQSIRAEQDIDLGPSFVRYTITGIARTGSPDSRVHWTKDENGKNIPTKPGYSASKASNG